MTYDPYAPAPGPGTPAGLPGAPVPTRRRPRRLVVGLVAAGVVVALGAGTAGAVAVRRLVVGSPDRLVALVPADAVAYAHVNLQPSASNLLGLASLAERLEEASGEDLLDADRFAEEVGEGEPVFADDIQPWLGRQAAAFALAPSDADAADGTTDAAALVLVSDRAAAEAFVTDHVDTTGDWDAGDGATGWQLAGEQVVALTDDLLVVGTTEAVGAVLDPADTSLADQAGYAELVDALPSSVASAWVDVEAVSTRFDELGAGRAGVLAEQVPVAQVALGLSLGSGAADLTTVSRPGAAAADAATDEPVAAASLADLPAGGLLYLRYPDAGTVLDNALVALDEQAEGTGEPLPSAQVDEGLAVYGTDVATVTGWLGDVVAAVAYDPTRAEDNVGLLVRAAVSDESAAAELVDALAADVPPDSGLDVAPGSISAGSASLRAGDDALSLQAGELGEGTLGEDPAWSDAVDGLPGEPVAYLDVRALTGALVPLLVGEVDPEDPQGLDVLTAFDRLVVTSERGDDGLERSSVRLSWGEDLQPLDLDAETNPPDVDLGGLGELEDLGGDLAGEPEDLDGLDLGQLDEDGFGAPTGTGGSYGDDATLDALWDGCEQGDDAACDELYLTSPLGSEYESFALTCGGRAPEGTYDCSAAGT